MKSERERKATLGIEALAKLQGFDPEELDEEGLPKVEVSTKPGGPIKGHYVFFNKAEEEARISVMTGGKKATLELAPKEMMSCYGDLTDDEELGLMTLLHDSTVTLTIFRPGGKVRYYEGIAPTRREGA